MQKSTYLNVFLITAVRVFFHVIFAIFLIIDQQFLDILLSPKYGEHFEVQGFNFGFSNCVVFVVYKKDTKDQKIFKV